MPVGVVKSVASALTIQERGASTPVPARVVTVPALSLAVNDEVLYSSENGQLIIFAKL